MLAEVRAFAHGPCESACLRSPRCLACVCSSVIMQRSVFGRLPSGGQVDKIELR